MEQEMQIPVPVFDTLNLNNQDDKMDFERDTPTEESSVGISEFVHVDVSNLEKSSAQQNSPIQGTSSPHIRKIIPTSVDESRFRKDFYCGSKFYISLVWLNSFIYCLINFILRNNFIVRY